MAVMFWVVTGICAALAVACVVGLIRQQMSPAFFEINDSAVNFIKGNATNQIPLNAIAKVEIFAVKTAGGRSHESSVVLTAHGRRFVIAKHMLPSANDYEQVKQHLFAVAGNRAAAKR